jgi:subtilisin-like proprotein convertase family protein
VAPDLLSAGANNAADPGETVTMKIDVTNSGALGATAVSAVLTSSTPGVVVNQGASAYPDLGPGATGTNATDYSITIPSGHACGDPVALSLAVSFDDGAPKMTNLGASLGTGVAQGASVSATPGIPINDNSQFTTNLLVTGTGANVSATFNVDMDISHTYQGDLIVTLRSPSGTNVILHNRTGGTTNDIIGNYPGTLTPSQSLAALLGEPLDGTWQLTVSDNATIDTGTLNAWGINDISGFDCDAAAVAATPLAALPSRFALDAPRPNPFGSATAIRFAVPGEGAAVDLEVFDIAGRHVRTLADGFHAPGFHSVDWNGRNEAGQRVGAGIYFYRLQAGDFLATRKVTLLN